MVILLSKLSSQNSKIIVALDFDKLKIAENVVEQLDPDLCKLKVGKEMFTLFGPSWVRFLVEKKFQVFLDLKFHDIPNTVVNACKAAADLGVWMINVHTLGGTKMMSEAANALATVGVNRPLLTGVTVLTSMDDFQFTQLGFQNNIQQQVMRLANLAKDSGLDGVVCSAQEASALKAKLGDTFSLVTPGIRPTGAALGDQSRVMTPAQALMAGSDYLVVGRPITQSSTPLKVLCEISESIKGL